VTADERDLTPEEEAELSGLLAEAGGATSAPPEVVARLDDVLAGLVAERASGAVSEDVAPVVSLEAERRRRWPTVLLAAAAVVVGGYGVGTALSGTSMSGDADSAGSAVTADSEGGPAGGSTAGGQALESAPGVTADERPPRLRPAHLAEDVRRVLDGTAGQASAARRSTALSDERADARAGDCAPARLRPDETWHLVRYDGQRAALVTAPAADDTVRASVVGCDGERLATVTVPAP
jgi:hypothetical protein